MNRSRLRLLSIILVLTIPMRAFAAENSYSMDAAAAANKAYEAKQSSEAGNSGVQSLTLRDLFDPVYYAFANPAAVTEAGNDPEALYYHFITKGIYQGYLCNSYFDIWRYRADHPELEELLGDNWDMWVLNLFTGNSSPTSLRATFDPVFYAASYPEVALQYGNDTEALYNHYISIGLVNGYIGNPYFDVFSYCTAHPELMGVYGNNWDAWIVDFYTKGIGGGAKAESQINGQHKTLAGYSESDDSDTITDGKGNFLVPIEEVIKYHTLDELREKCGNSLVLITDKDGYVTFVGGHFTDVLVSDEYDSVKAIECMLELIGFQEGKILRFSQSVEDSIGNVYYQFTESDGNTGAINYLSVISLGVDEDGKVISLSSNCGAKLSSEIDNGYEYKSKNQVSIEYVREYLKSQNLDLVSEKFDTIYIPAFNCYGNVIYGIDESGYIIEYFYHPVYDKISFIGKYSDIPTKENGLYAFSYLFSDDAETEPHVFKDYFGNDVTLSVASIIRDGKTYYYLVDKNRKIAANVQNPNQDDYFNKGFESLEDVYTYYVQSMVTIQKTYDFYKDLGFIDQYNNIPFIISFIEDDTEDNATCDYYENFFGITINNNKGNAAFDGVAHEIGHAVLLSSAPTTQYLEEFSIHEGYADITANILEMLCYLAGEKIGKIDLENWPIEESVDSIIRSMGEPEKYKSASKVGGENYIVTSFDSQNCHAHATILGNICYRMNKELNIPLEDLFRIWYDSVPNITSRSTYKDIQGIIEYSTMIHGYQDLADDVSSLFEDANVDGYSDNWNTLKPADDYVTYVPAVIDNYTYIYELLFKQKNNIINIVNLEKQDYALADKYGNIGVLIKKGDEISEYQTLSVYYDNKHYNYSIDMLDSKEQTHFDANDILSALFSYAGKTDDIEGFVSVMIDIDDDNEKYMLYRVNEEDEKHGYIYVSIEKQYQDTALCLRDDAKYAICRKNENGEYVLVDTFSTSDLNNAENPVIKFNKNQNSAVGVEIEVVSNGTTENSAAVNQSAVAATNSAAARALNITPEKKRDMDEETADGENIETNDGLSDTPESDSSDTEERNLKDTSDETLPEGENKETVEGSTATTESGNSDTEEERNHKDTSDETPPEVENKETVEGSTVLTESGNSGTEEEIDSKDSSDEPSSEGVKDVTDGEVNSGVTEASEENDSGEHQI